jgi:hypothetical protein
MLNLIEAKMLEVYIETILNYALQKQVLQIANDCKLNADLILTPNAVITADQYNPVILHQK